MMARPAKWKDPLSRKRKPLALRFNRIVSLDLSQPGAIVEKIRPTRENLKAYLTEHKAIAISRLADPLTDKEREAMVLVRRGSTQGTILRRTGITKAKLHRIRKYNQAYERRRARITRGTRRG
jgi:hypothetical protein